MLQVTFWKNNFFFVTTKVKTLKKYSEKGQNFRLSKNSLNEKEGKNKEFYYFREYETKLPHSFFRDCSAPSSSSFMWLQRTGRLDLNGKTEFGEKKSISEVKLKSQFRLDPLFLSLKKPKKKVKVGSYSTISIGEEKEEKMLMFNFSKKKKQISEKGRNPNYLVKSKGKKLEPASLYFEFNSVYSEQTLKTSKFFFVFLLLGLSYFFRL
jgi:hypothetical protein